MKNESKVYMHDSAYAISHNETDEYRESYNANMACKEAIENAINRNYADNRLNSKAALEEVTAQFSRDRIEYVLANTVQLKDWDRRICDANKKWAENIPVVMDKDAWGGNRNFYFIIDKAHTGLVDLFITRYREQG